MLAVGVAAPSGVQGGGDPASGAVGDAYAAPSVDDALDVEELRDPWEPFNRKMFTFNMRVDDYFIRPIATVYAKVLPRPARRGIDNVFSHVRFPVRFVNCLLQGKPASAYREVGRFFTNTTLGVAGLFDPAAQWYGVAPQDEDFGQTLGAYGVPGGPYVMVPFFGPSNVRDTAGFVADLATDPLSYVIGGTLVFAARAATEFSSRVNNRSLNLDLFEDVDRFTLDPYVAVQDFYVQTRERDVAD